MQPYFFPYVGYFSLLASVELFVFLDDVNFIKKGWINRNNILLNGQSQRITIPCKQISQNKHIRDIEVDFDLKARGKMVKTLEQAYSKSPFFQDFFPLVSDFIHSDTTSNIAELAANSVILVCDYLDLKVDFKFSSESHAHTQNLKGADRLIAIAKEEDASQYHNPPGGRDLYSKEIFENEGIPIHFIQNELIPYQQLTNSFIPWLSIIDVLMFNNKEESKKIIKSYTLN